MNKHKKFCVSVCVFQNKLIIFLYLTNRLFVVTKVARSLIYLSHGHGQSVDLIRLFTLDEVRRSGI
jgi:hypothetical protein